MAHRAPVLAGQRHPGEKGARKGIICPDTLGPGPSEPYTSGPAESTRYCRGVRCPTQHGAVLLLSIKLTQTAAPPFTGRETCCPTDPGPRALSRATKQEPGCYYKGYKRAPGPGVM